MQAHFTLGYQSMKRTTPKVDEYLSGAKKWQKESEKIEKDQSELWTNRRIEVG